jgi:hypothetical protein
MGEPAFTRLVLVSGSPLVSRPKPGPIQATLERLLVGFRSLVTSVGFAHLCMQDGTFRNCRGRAGSKGSMRIFRRVLPVAFAASVLLGGTAFAQTSPGAGSSSEILQLPNPPAHRLEWHWKRVHWGEIAGTAALATSAIVVSVVAEPSARWTRTNAFDDWFRDRLRVSPTTQYRIARASDALAITLIAFPVLVDSVGVALIGDKNKQVAGQLVAIQAQAYAMTGFLTSVTKVATGRQRPDAEEQGCDELDLDCGSGVNGSYFSGHTSFAFTGAGLTCVEHRYLRLFGRVGDPLACASALTLASVTGVFRIMANKHWATDVITGAGIGLFSGWLMPWLLHFRHDTSARHDGPLRALQYVSPYGSTDAFGLSAAGAF